MKENTFKQDIFFGLKALSESSFPKVCSSCGKKYKNAAQFLKETRDINNSKSGLKEAEEDNGEHIIEAFRNCSCGSTLMDYFSDRRDISDVGLKRRERFGALLSKLEENGIEASVARAELLKVLRGEHSELLNELINKK